MDISRTAIDGLALIATGGADAAQKMTEILASISKAASDLGRPDLALQAIDALAAIAAGGPDAWRKPRDVLVAAAKAASELRGGEGATRTASR